MNSAYISERTANGKPSPGFLGLKADLDRETRLVQELLGTFTTRCQGTLRSVVLKKQLLQHASADSRQNAVMLLLNKAADLKEESLQIQRHILQKASDLRRAGVKPTDKKLVESMLLEEQVWCASMRGGSVSTGLLSDIHTGIRSLHQGLGNNEGKIWQAPQTFVRETHKYWVKEELLGEVMLACASEAPLLVYGLKRTFLFGPDEAIDASQDLFQLFATDISSVYFDSPLFTLYHERLARTEGSQLFRVRWYGNTQPQGEKTLFLELKMHHESWVNADSTKERVAIQEKHMDMLLKRDGKRWFLEDAESIVTAAKPDQSDKQMMESVDLLLRIRNLVIKKDLRPCVRTCYKRVSFQSSTSNELRLTVDRDVQVYDERGAPVGAWCRPNIKKTTITSKRIPCAIFEVKLAGKGMPEFVQHLEHKSHTIASAHKFSKFLTGVSVINSEASAVRTLPYWAAEPMFRKLYNKKEGEDNSNSITSKASFESSERTDDSVTPKPRRRLEQNRSTLSTLETQSSNFMKRAVHFARGEKWADLSSDAAADIEAGIHERRSRPSSCWNRISRRRSDKKKIAPTKRARIEPKTYFAAERTFIQWISAALLLITVASVLSSLGLQSTKVPEFTLMILAALVTVYSLVIYFRRLYLLEKALPYGYQDHAGPVVLSTAVLAGILTMLYFFVAQHRGGVLSTASVEVQPGKCMLHEFQGVSLLEFQPSDIVVDRARDMFIMPSLTELVYIPRKVNDGEVMTVQNLVIVENADIEALSFGDFDTLFAVSEDPESSVLLAFQWMNSFTSSIHKLELIGKWKLKGASNVEGMVYEPGNIINRKPPRILISGKATDPLQSNVYIYDVPAEFDLTESALKPVHQLNTALLSSGLSPLTSAKISAMTLFEGILYILHDNARVIRGWDLATGEMMSEWITPRVGGEFDKQWEGISMERVDGTVLLHMTLDTPPQIWSFFLEETARKTSSNPALSSFTFPPCAQAF